MDLLITDPPDSLGFLVKRANLNLKAGKAEEALADLRRLRSEGRVDFAIIDAEASILAATGETSQAAASCRPGQRQRRAWGMPGSANRSQRRPSSISSAAVL